MPRDPAEPSSVLRDAHVAARVAAAAPCIGLVCPTMWDEAEVPALVASGRYRVRPYGDDASEHPQDFDADAFIDAAVRHFGALGVDGILASDDYPGTPVAALVAQRLGLPGPSPEAVLLCQHKYYARLAQREVVAHAVPPFWLVDPCDLERARREVRFPAFVKPVKSFFSLHAQPVRDADELAAMLPRAAGHLREFVRPLNQMLARFPRFEHDAGHLLAEGLLRGRQVTVEGCAWRGEVRIVGIVDSIMYPGTISFRRFEYPSALDAQVQERMGAIARAFIGAIGFGDGLFNIEMMFDPDAGSVHIIEVNPRMCPQFADLMEKVNGVNTYEIALDIAAGRRPAITREGARFAAAASLVPRLFEDRRVTRVPGPGDLERLAREFPDARLKVLCREGHRLGEELQDGSSYRYAVLNIGGDSREHAIARGARALGLLPFGFEPVGA